MICQRGKRGKEHMARKKHSTAQPFLLSVQEVAIHLGVCRQAVYSYIYREGLPSMVIGGVRRIHPDALRDWLKAHEKQL
jgi:excisionase family DNA binding protein